MSNVEEHADNNFDDIHFYLIPKHNHVITYSIIEYFTSGNVIVDCILLVYERDLILSTFKHENIAYVMQIIMLIIATEINVSSVRFRKDSAV